MCIRDRAKARQTLKVKAEVDGVEQVEEFTLIPPQGLMYAGAESPFRPVSYTHLDVYKRQSPYRAEYTATTP